MQISRTRVLTALVLTTLVAGAGRADTKDLPAWKAKMAELNTAFSDLLPYLFSESRFSDKKNRPLIEEKTRTLVNLADVLDQHSENARKVPSPDADPSVRFVSHAFKDELSRGYDALKAGHDDYARGVLRSSLSYCIACHTRGTTGAHFQSDTLTRELKQLRPLERLNVYAATRQFDAAMDEFRKNIATKRSPEVQAFDLERSSRIALAIAVRVKQDPKQALTIVHDVTQSPAAAESLKQDAEGWREAVVLWQAEGPLPVSNEAMMLKTARDLIAKAKQQQEYPVDPKGDVYYLRASSVLHEFLNRYPESKNLGEALQMTGQSYEALRDLGIWSLHEMYYQACIRKAPGTPISKECYARYEDSVVAGYTGSRGVSLPPSIQKDLNELKKLSAPSKSEKKKKPTKN